MGKKNSWKEKLRINQIYRKHVIWLFSFCLVEYMLIKDNFWLVNGMNKKIQFKKLREDAFLIKLFW